MYVYKAKQTTFTFLLISVHNHKSKSWYKFALGLYISQGNAAHQTSTATKYVTSRAVWMVNEVLPQLMKLFIILYSNVIIIIIIILHIRTSIIMYHLLRNRRKSNVNLCMTVSERNKHHRIIFWFTLNCLCMYLCWWRWIDARLCVPEAIKQYCCKEQQHNNNNSF